MPQESEWILFRIKERKFATRANLIKEILWFLPLNPSTVGGRGIFATLPLRGEIVLVLDLRFFWGEAPEQYSIEDSLILIEGNIAVPISDVLEVVSFEENAYTVSGDEKGVLEERVYHGEVVTLLDFSKLYPQETLKRPWETESFSAEDAKKLEWYQVGFHGMTQESKEILKRRLKSYKKNSDDLSLDQGGMDAISIVKSGEEDFGIPLENVVEFSDPSQLTPLPGASSILQGCMNLRGDVLPVISLAEILGQSRDKPFQFGKVIILKESTNQFGLLVDELVDVVYKKNEEKLIAPLSAKGEGGSLLEASYPHTQGYVNVISISSLINRVKQSLG